MFSAGVGKPNISLRERRGEVKLKKWRSTGRDLLHKE
jgi:hypothetical protein